MKNLVKLSLLTLLYCLQSCDSAKKVTNVESSKSEETVAMNKKLIKEGFSVGTIEYLSNTDCHYIIVDENSGSKLDPINIDSDKFKGFKKGLTKVYFKYRNLRRTNRCNIARPIEIVEMQKA